MATSKLALSLTDREPRGQTAITCRVLQNPRGLTAQQLLKANGGTTPHNSWSLTRVAERFGFNLVTAIGEDGLKRYRFVVPAKRVTKAKPGARKGNVAAKRRAA